MLASEAIPLLIRRPLLLSLAFPKVARWPYRKGVPESVLSAALKERRASSSGITWPERLYDWNTRPWGVKPTPG